MIGCLSISSYEDHNKHVTDRSPRDLAQCLTLGASGRQRHRTSVPGNGGHAAAGERRLTRQHRVLQGLLGHHVGKTAEDSRAAEAHQVLGLPGQAVLASTAMARAAAHGALKVPGRAWAGGVSPVWAGGGSHCPQQAGAEAHSPSVGETEDQLCLHGQLAVGQVCSQMEHGAASASGWAGVLDPDLCVP